MRHEVELDQLLTFGPVEITISEIKRIDRIVEPLPALVKSITNLDVEPRVGENKQFAIPCSNLSLGHNLRSSG